ncbi:unnamed protein product [Ilex paraguariensis]|uniref:Uncharacterized protein n=1 Tax=Ilex paraguariensis TaxID=185542 RepID=A0ABC8RVZ7_9AQUA
MVQRDRYDSSINVDDSRLLFSIWYGEGEQSFQLNIRVSLAWDCPVFLISIWVRLRFAIHMGGGWDRERPFKQQLRTAIAILSSALSFLIDSSRVFLCRPIPVLFTSVGLDLEQEIISRTDGHDTDLPFSEIEQKTSGICKSNQRIQELNKNP